MVIRTITVDWLTRNDACQEGIEVFKRVVGGDRVTMRFTGADWKWMYHNFYNDHHICMTLINYYGNGRDNELTADRLYGHVEWLYRKIMHKSSELLQDMSNYGYDLEYFPVEDNVKEPSGYIIELYSNNSRCLRKIRESLRSCSQCANHGFDDLGFG